MTIKEQLIEAIDELNEDQQYYVLSVARQLRRATLPHGTLGDVLIGLLEDLTFTSQDVNEMMTAIKDADGIDWDSWQ